MGAAAPAVGTPMHPAPGLVGYGGAQTGFYSCSVLLDRCLTARESQGCEPAHLQSVYPCQLSSKESSQRRDFYRGLYKVTGLILSFMLLSVRESIE